MARKYTYLQPTYYKEFRCSGDKCITNCCSYNWFISVDKETYKKYKAVKEPKEFAETLNKYVKRNRRAKSDAEYAKIIHDRNLSTICYDIVEDDKELEQIEIYNEAICPFQDKSGLCEIHKNLGYEGLCKTCKIYPRILNNIFGNYERSMNIGCEEVSKLLYKMKDGIAFEIVEEDEEFEDSVQTDLSKVKSKIFEYFDDIRLVCLQILQYRELSIDDRMILLSVFMFKIDEFETNNEYDKISNYIETFFDNIDMYKPLFDIETRREDVALKVIVEVNNYSRSKVGDKKLTLELKKIQKNLERALEKEYSTDENPLKKIGDKGIISSVYAGYRDKYNELMKDKEYFVENIFVNMFFISVYPFNNLQNIKECCTTFIWTYLYYKAILSAELSDKEEATEEILHMISTIFGRSYADQFKSLQRILKGMKECNMDNVAFLAVLIKSL